VTGDFRRGDDLKFLVRHEPRYRNWGAAIVVLLSGRTPRIAGWLTFFDKNPMRLQHPHRTRTLTTSLLFHFSVFLFVLKMPWAKLLAEPGRVALPLPTQDYQMIYPLPPHKVEIPSRPKSAAKGERKMAKAEPKSGAERAAGAGVKTPQPTPQFTLVLKPPHPDNNHQTIIQAGAPPDLRIKHDVPLPNVLLAGMVSQKDPKMPLTGSAPKPVANPAAGTPSMNVPEPVIPDMALAVQVPSEKPPLLASPEVALPMPAPEQNLGSIFAAKREGTAAQSGRGLLVLGANPNPPANLMSVPLGNRYGQFSVSLLGGKTGVPSGPGGPAMGGGGNANSGSAKGAGAGAGAGSMSVSGDVGGAGNGASAVAAFGPSSNGSGNDAGILPPWMVSNLVYPVARSPRRPAINLIVTAGPIGGGGLGMFGVLSCPAIYTIYLQMPGKPWVLQYCQHNAPAPKTPAPNGGEVHLGAGLVPPYAESKYDFHRPPVSEYKRDRMIVLQGTIEKDGTVKNLKVYQGVGSMADQAALAAFGKWKFHPAIGPNGKPTAVDLLVGIPATLPQ
jgi:TonB family protein